MKQDASSDPASGSLRRELGLFGAVMMGLGSIVGTGVFVSMGIAAGVAGPAVTLAVVIGALVATANGLSSAQLAASHPVSGGTYEYGYKYLNPWFGFAAGWMFLCAKSASAATAALGFAGYVLAAFGVSHEVWRIGLGLAAVVVLTLVILGGMRQSNRTNTIVVSITLAALVVFVLAGIRPLLQNGALHFTPFWGLPGEEGSPLRGLLHASALMFVAYTGYGRIATLGEEVRSPRTTIPRAIIVTLIASMILYVSVAVVAVGVAGADQFAEQTQATSAPLEVIAAAFGVPGAPAILAAGAITAMLGVLLNLLLGLSRVVLAMGRRRDLPAAVARVSETSKTPEAAVIVVAVLIAALVLIGDVRITWSFSAFTVLVYYAITNLAALQMPAEQRLFPRGVAMAGLLACLFLAFWVEPGIWISGSLILAAGFVGRWLMRRL